MALDLSKMFLPLSILNRLKKTTTQQNNVLGTIPNNAISIPQLFTEVAKSDLVRTNFTNPNVATTIGGIDQATALPLNNKALHIITPGEGGESAKLPKATLNLIVEVHNINDTNDLELFVLENDSLLNVVDDSITISPQTTVKFFANTSNNWIIL